MPSLISFLFGIHCFYYIPSLLFLSCYPLSIRYYLLLSVSFRYSPHDVHIIYYLRSRLRVSPCHLFLMYSLFISLREEESYFRFIETYALKILRVGLGISLSIASIVIHLDICRRLSSHPPKAMSSWNQTTNPLLLLTTTTPLPPQRGSSWSEMITPLQIWLQFQGEDPFELYWEHIGNGKELTPLWNWQPSNKPGTPKVIVACFEFWSEWKEAVALENTQAGGKQGGKPQLASTISQDLFANWLIVLLAQRDLLQTHRP